MSNETDDKPEFLAALPAGEMPPAFLEERVVARLKDANYIHSSRVREFRGYPAMLIAIALALATFIAGAFIGARRSLASRRSAQAGYLLIVRAANAKSEAGNPQEEMQRVKEYSAWARDLQNRGLLVGGEKLKDEVNVLSGEGVTVNERRSSANEGAVAGYFVLPVVEYERALEIAKSCPHLKHGGAVELRQIERFQ